MKKTKIKILFEQFYNEYDCEAVAGRLFHMIWFGLLFAQIQELQIYFETSENQWTSLEN